MHRIELSDDVNHDNIYLQQYASWYEKHLDWIDIILQNNAMSHKLLNICCSNITEFEFLRDISKEYILWDISKSHLKYHPKFAYSC